MVSNFNNYLGSEEIKVVTWTVFAATIFVMWEICQPYTSAWKHVYNSDNNFQAEKFLEFIGIRKIRF